MSEFEFLITPEQANIRIDIFITQKIELIPSRGYSKNLIESGNVLVNGKKIKPHYKISEGNSIKVTCVEVLEEVDQIEPENIDLDVFYEDEDLAVICKPSGLTVHPIARGHGGTLVNALLYRFNNLSDVNGPRRPGIVHRLDKETSGLMIVSKTNEAHQDLAKQFKAQKVKKQYVALVDGWVEFNEGVVDMPIGPHPRHHDYRKFYTLDEIENPDTKKEHIRQASTAYKVQSRSKKGKKRSLVALFPKTGRTHQLRLHMQYLGHPILGDDKYGKKESFSRLALHAQSIGFMHPKHKKLMTFTRSIPSQFQEAV